MGRRSDDAYWALSPQRQEYERKVLSGLYPKYGLEKLFKKENDGSNDVEKIVGKVKESATRKSDPKVSSLRMEEQDDQLDTNSETRKLESLFKSYIKSLRFGH